MFPISWDGKTPSLLNIDSKPNGFYNLYFVNEDHVPVSFTLEVTQFSRGVSYACAPRGWFDCLIGYADKLSVAGQAAAGQVLHGGLGGLSRAGAVLVVWYSLR